MASFWQAQKGLVGCGKAGVYRTDAMDQALHRASHLQAWVCNDTTAGAMDTHFIDEAQRVEESEPEPQDKGMAGIRSSPHLRPGLSTSSLTPSDSKEGSVMRCVAADKSGFIPNPEIP